MASADGPSSWNPAHHLPEARPQKEDGGRGRETQGKGAADYCDSHSLEHLQDWLNFSQGCLLFFFMIQKIGNIVGTREA